MSSRELHHTPPPIPNGWFAVAFSRDLVPGEVKRIRYFDEELVLFRTRSGQARVLDAYCAHLGAHLAEGGRVVGENLACPFHAWQYDGTGRCVEIPYCPKIPPLARVRGWDVTERNQLIFVWHHAEGKPPEWEVNEIVELAHPDWTEPRSLLLEVPVHMQDMHENNNDPIHFKYVHGNFQPRQTAVHFGEGGRSMHMVSHGKTETPYGSFDSSLETDSWGLGLTAVRICGIPNAGLLMYSSTSPVDRGLTHSRWLFTVTRNLADVAGEEFIAALSDGVKQDLRIWQNKVHRANPVLCEGDTGLSEFRRWARQFYSDPS
jgi:phenylpropionate dioxygenase-like ring-hydroxylating dioxygenase large terminal subunit